MVKPLVDPIIFWAFVGIAIVVVFIAGFLTSQQCITIDTCTQCWNNIARETQSEACPSGESCVVEPYVAQHNAITDALVCACNKASNANYADNSLNQQILTSYEQLYGSKPTIEEVCGSGLVRVRY